MSNGETTGGRFGKLSRRRHGRPVDTPASIMSSSPIHTRLILCRGGLLPFSSFLACCNGWLICYIDCVVQLFSVRDDQVCIPPCDRRGRVAGGQICIQY